MTFKQGSDFVELGTFVGDPPEHIDPGLNQTLDAYQVVNALYDGLTDIDASDPDNPVIRPQVAESYEANDDATVWTFKVHKGLQLSNGEKVLPSSFARAWERASDPDFAGVYSYLMTFIKGGAEKLDGKADTLEGVEADDDAMTLTVTLAAPYSNFDAVAGFQLFFPMPKAVEELDDQTQWDNGMMVGNGPFMLDKPRSDTEIVLVRNPKWDGTKYDKGFKLPKKPYLGIPGFKEGLCEFCAYDKEAAQDAYDEWKADGNELKDPIKIQFNIDAGHEDVVDLIIDDWKAIGIPAERQGIDTETYFTQLSDGACTVCRAGWFADYPTYDNFMFDLWGSESPRRSRSSRSAPAQPATPPIGSPATSPRPTRFSDPQSRRRKRRPVLGLGWKNVVFGGMRSPPWAVASIWAMLAGRSRTPAWASPEATRRRTLSGPCWKVSVCSGSSARATSRRAESRSRASASASGRGRSRTSRSGSTRHSAPASSMAVVTGTSVGGGPSGSNHGERASTRSRPAGSPVIRRWMARTVSSSSTSSTTYASVATAAPASPPGSAASRSAR